MYDKRQSKYRPLADQIAREYYEGQTAKVLAERCGVSTGTIHRWARSYRDRHPEFMEELANV